MKSVLARTCLDGVEEGRDVQHSHSDGGDATYGNE